MTYRKTDPAPLEKFLDNGLLWYINRTCFHPHGLALGISPDDGTWTMHVDDEPWSFTEEIDIEKYGAYQAYLTGLRE